MSTPPVEDIMKEIQARVAERRAAGDYPIGLEAELEAEFDAILEMTHRGQDRIEVLEQHITNLEEAIKKISGRTPVRSRVPGGRLIHRTLAALTRRQVVGLSAQVKAADQEVLATLRTIVAQLEEQRLSDDRAMNKLANAVLDRVVVVDQLASSLVELERRLDKLQSERNG